MSLLFERPFSDKADQEEGSSFAPKFGANDLITAVVTAASDGEPLMVAHMNEEALKLTLDTGVAHFYSRSRKALWKKGETSGNTLSVRQILVDCDQDCLWLKVDVADEGPACHTGRRSCFYRQVETDNGAVRLTFRAD